jgi:hypothetical protein
LVPIVGRCDPQSLWYSHWCHHMSAVRDAVRTQSANTVMSSPARIEYAVCQ